MKKQIENVQNQKLVIVTRKDISPGYQAVQSAHAIPQFAYEHSQVFYEWYKNSNYLVLLSVKDEDSLKRLIHSASQKGIKHSVFTEPDLNNQITSIALEPSSDTYKLVSNIPLALKEYNHLHIKEKEAEDG